MLSHSLSRTAQTTVALVVAGSLRATRREAGAPRAGHDPCETGALGNG
ncbi:hypothetical protein MK786_10525 [Microbacterium sp. CFH 31415]|nr:hypothetical protein [Microbacterium sp. CFH 31415]MCH6231172.1 hypothetical protein [Microbacterium sp. CFH 31415]